MVDGECVTDSQTDTSTGRPSRLGQARPSKGLLGHNPEFSRLSVRPPVPGTYCLSVGLSLRIYSRACACGACGACGCGGECFCCMMDGWMDGRYFGKTRQDKTRQGSRDRLGGMWKVYDHECCVGEQVRTAYICVCRCDRFCSMRATSSTRTMCDEARGFRIHAR